MPEPGHAGHGAGHGTRSVCPVCLRTIDARRVKSGHDVLLVKTCPEHGDFSAVVWRGSRPSFGGWARPKTPSRPHGCFTDVDQGCPHDCGLCPDHGQHTCTALLEVTQRCNLRCPVCFADAGNGARDPDQDQDSDMDPDMDTIAFWYDRARQGGGQCNIQLSGGEPTVRDDLPAIIAMGRDKDFNFIQLNTNGLRLAREPGYARELRHAGLASVFLQFDGVDDEVFLALRGRALWAEKQEALARCGDAGLGVVLVPTLVPGVNDHALGDILRFALRAGPHVRGVHFQPMSHFGRYPGASPQGPRDEQRLTLPEVMRGLEEQSRGLVRVEHLAPPGCEHALCSFHGNYLRTGQQPGMIADPHGVGLKPLTTGGKACCSTSPPTPTPAAEGAARSIGYTARQWAGPPECSCSSQEGAPGLEEFLDQMRAWTFSISAMAFQDAWNLDLERLKGCCIHVVAPDGRLIPFCAYNLTASNGTPLYRGKDKRPS